MKTFLIVAITAINLLVAQTELFLKPVVGKVYSSQMNMNMVIEMSIGDKKMTVPTQTVMYFEMKPTGIESNGNVTIEFVTKRVVMDVTDPKTKKIQHYDSDKPQNTDEYKKTNEKFKDKIGKKMLSTFTNKGEMIENDSTETSSLSQLIIKLPKDPIKKGSKWISESTNEEGTPSKTEFKVLSIDNELATLQSSTKSEKMNDPMKGKTTLDVVTGLIHNATSSADMDLGIMKMKIDIEIIMN